MSAHDSDQNTMYHLQEDDDEEGTALADDEELEKVEDAEGGKALTSEQVERVEEIRKIRLGKVDIDPRIDYQSYKTTGPGLDAQSYIDEDGLINVSLTLKKALGDLPPDYAQPVKEEGVDTSEGSSCPPLNIVIFIVGSRGDVQPYLALALQLIKVHGHRVRIATHNDFEAFVLDTGKAQLGGKTGRDGNSLEGMLEFFGVGGSPKELMAYMVKNPGLLPGFESLTNGDIPSKRKMTAEMLHNFHRSTFSPDLVSGTAFAADAIISNPPAFAHVHVAEALGLPLLMSFTMPWSPTTAFNHPLVNIKQSNAEKGLTNYLSYALAEMMTWQGLGDIINQFRAKDLGLPPMSLRSGPSVLDRLKVPYVYCWSPALIPKPDDWQQQIDVTGFLFLQTESYTPDPKLKAFLDSGPPPVYIGFGSVPVDDPDTMTKIILEAVKKAGVRALISAGWGEIGGKDVPDDVFILGNVPHDWLFAEDRVVAVCHHGGAGTVSAGLRNGRPTIIVPFFGDQPWWARKVADAGAGPEPIPHKQLNAEVLADALKFAVSAPAKAAAGKMGEQIRGEEGEAAAANAFHRHLPLLNMRCDLDSKRVALWWSDELALKLSGLAAETLSEAKLLSMKKLEPHRPREYDTIKKATDPLSGGASEILKTIVNYHVGIAQIFTNPPKGILKMHTAIPKGILNILSSMHEGMESLPELYGSERRRPPEKVNNFASGVQAAGKGLFFGYFDAITGLVTEPLEGAKKEGFVGFVKGSGRSYINATIKPATGILGVVAHPANGLLRSIQKLKSPNSQDVLLKPRRDQSKRDYDGSSQSERHAILAAFAEADKKTKERKDDLRKRAKEYLLMTKKAQEKARAENKAPVNAKLKEGYEAQADESAVQVSKDDGTIPPSSNTVVDDMSEAERRGYERAMAEMQKGEPKPPQ